LKNFQKIFIFVERDPAGKITQLYLKMFILYIYQTFDLEKETIKKIIPKVSPLIKKELMTTYDIAVAEGYQKGKLEGKIEGKLEGQAFGEIKSSFNIFGELIIKFPNWSDELLSDISKLPKPTVSILKKAFNGTQRKAFIQAARQLFILIPNLTSEKWQEVDKLSLDLWKRFKKQLKKEE